MGHFLLKRLMSLVPILLIVGTITFLIIHVTPGDPASVILGPEASAEQIANLRDDLGLNLPIYQQYFTWMFGVLQGNLGESFYLQQPILEAIREHLAPTLVLAGMALVIGILLAVPLGIAAARRRGTFVDHASMGLSLIGISVPSFLLGIFFVVVFAVKLGWFPVAGYVPITSGLWNYLQYLIMPAVALGAMQAGLLARMTRSSMLDTLGKDFISAARAKGAAERRVVYIHAFRNALLPVMTVVGQSLGGLITGAVVIETIFNIPGLGQLIINAVSRRDFPVIQATVLVTTVAFVLVNFAVDILYGAVDPRIRLGQKAGK